MNEGVGAEILIEGMSQPIPQAAVSNGFQYSCVTGLGGDTGHIIVPQADVDEIEFFNVKHPMFVPLQGGSGSSGSDQIPSIGSIGIRARVDLYNSDGSKYTLPYVYLKDNGIQVVTEDMGDKGQGGDGPLIKIDLTSALYFWRKRGFTGYVNGNWLKKVAREGSRPRSGGPQAEDFWKHTLHPGRKDPWTFKDCIDHLLPRLPGKVEAGKIPDDIRDELVLDIDWPGDMPFAQDALQWVIDQFDLFPSYDPFLNQLNFNHRGQGKIGSGRENSREIPEDRVVSSKKGQAYSFPLEAVEIYGPPAIREARALPEAVGPKVKKDTFGNWEADLSITSPLGSWLSNTFGLTIESAGRLILQEPKVISEEIKDKGKRAIFSRFAFKLYRLKDRDARKYLPIDDRVEINLKDPLTPPVRRHIYIQADAYGELPDKDEAESSAMGKSNQEAAAKERATKQRNP